ncbi:hypothetical protein ACLOJK_036108 [Asimina triloba]
MRLNGEISYRKDEEKENERISPQPKLVVGYALTSKKTKSFLQPKLERLASVTASITDLCAKLLQTWELRLYTFGISKDPLLVVEDFLLIFGGHARH